MLCNIIAIPLSYIALLEFHTIFTDFCCITLKEIHYVMVTELCYITLPGCHCIILLEFHYVSQNSLYYISGIPVCSSPYVVTGTVNFGILLCLLEFY